MVTTPAALAALPYDAFVEQALAFFAALPLTDYAAALPAGYLTGWRSWDSQMALRYGDFQPTDRVLETGAWQTFLALFLTQFVDHIDATDSFYWEQRAFVKEQHLPSSSAWRQTIHELSQGRVLAYKLDLQAIDCPDNTYDKITCISTVEHVLDDTAAMREMLRVLRPGGRLLVTTEYDETRGKPYSEDDGSWYRVYSSQTWSELLAPYHVLHQEIDVWRGPHWFRTAFACIEKG